MLFLENFSSGPASPLKYNKIHSIFPSKWLLSTEPPLF